MIKDPEDQKSKRPRGRPPKAVKDPKDPKESKELKEPKEPKEPRLAREPKELKEPKQALTIVSERESALPEMPDDAPTEAVRAGSQAADPAFAVPADKRVVIGVTGEPGAGKSSLARQLGALGGTVIDVDKLGHELLDSPRMKRDLVVAFGDEILNEDGEIDRRALAALAFSSAEATAKLNSVVHPKLASRTRALVAKHLPFVVVDAGLLHEMGLGDLCTTCIYMKASREARTARVAERGWDELELQRRETALGNADGRRKACQLAVDNSGDPALLAGYAKTILARQIGLDLAQLKKSAPARQQAQPDDQSSSTNQNEADDSSESSAEQDSGSNNEDSSRPNDQRGSYRDTGRDLIRDNNGRDSNSRDNNSRDQSRDPSRDQRGDRQGFNRHGQTNDQRGLNPNNGSQQPNQSGPGFPNGNQQANDNRPAIKLILDDYLNRKLPDLQAEAEKLEVRDVKWQKKADLICEILRRAASGRADEIVVEGYMEIIKEQGYIRSPLNAYAAVNTDTFVSIQQLRRYGLKSGMQVTGTARAPRGNEKCPQLLSITQVMNEPENKRSRFRISNTSFRSMPMNVCSWSCRTTPPISRCASSTSSPRSEKANAA